VTISGQLRDRPRAGSRGRRQVRTSEGSVGHVEVFGWAA
jgi:hypothetical protein